MFFLSCVSPNKATVNLQVKDVVDGDTVVLSDGRHMRLIGIDTPEIHIKEGNDFVFSPKPFSLMAKKTLEDLVKNKIIEVEFDIEKKDKYDRLLGYCFLNTKEGRKFVNKELIEKGLAVIYFIPPNLKYFDDLSYAQKQAVENKLGLWQDQETASVCDAGDFVDQIRSLKGHMDYSYSTNKGVVLGFGCEDNQDFHLFIFKDILDFFVKKGINLEKYKGKEVRVLGRIKMYNKYPEMIISSASQIELN